MRAEDVRNIQGQIDNLMVPVYAAILKEAQRGRLSLNVACGSTEALRIPDNNLIETENLLFSERRDLVIEHLKKNGYEVVPHYYVARKLVDVPQPPTKILFWTFENPSKYKTENVTTDVIEAYTIKW